MTSPFQGLTRKPSYGRKSVDKESSFHLLMNTADDVFSKAMRNKAADSSGIIKCFICWDEVRKAEADLMHYIPRGVKILRYSEINCKAGCKNCNQNNNGNLEKFRERLIEEHGLAEVENLESLRHSMTKLSRLDLLEIIERYSK